MGEEVAEKILIHNRGQLVEANTIKLALKMADIFDSLKIPYLIGGSVASSILGELRATLDVDMVADLQLSQVQPLVTIMTGDFYIDEIMIREAIANKSSFNVIHIESMQKVDVFVLSDRPLAQVEMQRRQQLLITENPEKFAWLPSSEDIVLQKLTYCLGNETSDTQWRDVLGVLKVQTDIDLDYLSQWAETLNLTELMTKALQQAGIN